jgi:hypothetical protein
VVEITLLYVLEGTQKFVFASVTVENVSQI